MIHNWTTSVYAQLVCRLNELEVGDRLHDILSGNDEDISHVSEDGCVLYGIGFLQGYATAAGMAVPDLVDRIKIEEKSQYFCDDCGERVDEQAVTFTELPFNIASANAGESAVICPACCAKHGYDSIGGGGGHGRSDLPVGCRGEED